MRKNLYVVLMTLMPLFGFQSGQGRCESYASCERLYQKVLRECFCGHPEVAVLELSASQTCNSTEIKWACLYNGKDCCDNCSDRTVSVKQGVTSQTCNGMELKWACLYDEKDCYHNCSKEM